MRRCSWCLRPLYAGGRVTGTGAGGDGVASFGSTRPGAQHPPRAMHPPWSDGSADNMTTDCTCTVTALHQLPIQCTLTYLDMS